MATQPDNYGLLAKQSAQQSNTPDTRSSGQGSAQQSGTTSSTQTTNSSTQNMDPQSLAALQLLIQQLMGGGTQQMANDMAARKGEINKVTQQRAGYSKDAAFSDAQGLMAQTMRRVMEQLVPSISRAAEGAGASQSSLRALLLQDAANKAAESSAAQGLNAAVQYGQIGANLSQVLEALTRPDNTVTNALLNALSIAKGAVTNTQGVTNTVGQTQTNTQTNERKQTDYAPFSAPVGGMTVYGPADNTSPILQFSTNADLKQRVSELLNENSFSGFRF